MSVAVAVLAPKPSNTVNGISSVSSLHLLTFSIKSVRVISSLKSVFGVIVSSFVTDPA